MHAYYRLNIKRDIFLSVVLLDRFTR